MLKRKFYPLFIAAAILVTSTAAFGQAETQMRARQLPQGAIDLFDGRNLAGRKLRVEQALGREERQFQSVQNQVRLTV